MVFIYFDADKFDSFKTFLEEPTSSLVDTFHTI